MRPAPGDTRFRPMPAFGVFLGASAIAIVGGAILVGATGHAGDTATEMPLWLLFATQFLLWVPLVVGTVLVDRNLGTGDLSRDLGLSFRTFDLLGIPIGIASQLVIVDGIYRILDALGVDTSELDERARSLTDRADTAGRVVMLFLMVVVGAPLVEELFFRGLLMRSIQARWDDLLALVVSSVFFGFVHLQGLQFVGLVAFGLVAGICAQRTGRLGMSILAHAAFNATALVALLLE